MSLPSRVVKNGEPCMNLTAHLQTWQWWRKDVGMCVECMQTVMRTEPSAWDFVTVLPRLPPSARRSSGSARARGAVSTQADNLTALAVVILTSNRATLDFHQCMANCLLYGHTVYGQWSKQHLSIWPFIKYGLVTCSPSQWIRVVQLWTLCVCL